MTAVNSPDSSSSRGRNLTQRSLEELLPHPDRPTGEGRLRVACWNAASFNGPARTLATKTWLEEEVELALVQELKWEQKFHPKVECYPPVAVKPRSGPWWWSWHFPV
jgi:hypothetical protein